MDGHHLGTITLKEGKVMPNVTIYKKRNVWWMQYRIHGTRMRQSLSTRNESVARRKAKTHEQKLIKGEGEEVKRRIKIESFWEIYLPHAKTTKRPKTFYNDFRFWSRFSDWLATKQIKYVDQISAQV